MVDLIKCKKIIYENWSHEDNDEFGDEIEYIADNGDDILVLDANTGKVSIYRKFFYDDAYDSVQNEESYNDITYLYERAFCVMMNKESYYNVEEISDTVTDFGYPGTDYWVGIGFVSEACTKKLIEEYVRISNYYDTRITKLDSVLEYLLKEQIGYQEYRFIKDKISYSSTQYEGLDIEYDYEGMEQYFVRIGTDLFSMDCIFYKKIEQFFKNNTLRYEKKYKDQSIYFIGQVFTISFPLEKTLASQVELEKIFFRENQKREQWKFLNVLDCDKKCVVKTKPKEVIRQDDLFIECILSAIIKLAQNQLYHQEQKSENRRNDYIRDILDMPLRQNGYELRDQTRTGISASGKNPGEADMVIYSEEGLPCTYIEALNLNRVDLTYIFEHIDRLFKYDQIGVSTYFILVYVSVDDFSKFIREYRQKVQLWRGEEIFLLKENDYHKGNLRQYHFRHVKNLKFTYVASNYELDIYHILVLLN